MTVREIKDLLTRWRTPLRALSDDLWSHPELAYMETYAAARAEKFLKSQGYAVTIPYCGLDTAFRCEYGSEDGPVFAFASEYDALPHSRGSSRISS